ncbi:MAG: GDP-mannose 4,6-dehydratase [Promethearchaeota archaeon]
MIKNKKILITGAAGFIGSNLTEELLKHENYLVLIDNYNDFYEGKEEQLNAIIKNYRNSEDYKVIKGNILDASLYDKLDDDFDYIFHLAAYASVRYSIEHAAAVTHNNVTGTVNLLEYALKLNNIKKFVNASSSSVYGNPVYTPLDENHPKNPICPYAISKLCSEIYADYYFREFSLPITSLRFYTVYGPRGRPDMAVRKFFNLIFKKQEIPIYGNGEQLRDFTYISDIIDGLILSGEIAKAEGEIFNLGCSDPISVNQLVDKMYSITGEPKKVRYFEKQIGDVDITHSDITKAEKILGYNPKVSIDKGLENTYEWQRERLSSD